MIYMLALRGTAEPLAADSNMLAHVRNVARRHTGLPVTYIDVPYPASVSFANEGNDIAGASIAASIASADAKTTEIARDLLRVDSTAQFVLTGYSLGALATLLIAHKRRFPIARVVTIANPALQPGEGHGHSVIHRAPVGYSGIVTEYGRGLDMPTPAFHIAHPADGISYLHPKSPLRRIAPYLWTFDLDDPLPWLLDLGARLSRGELLAPLLFWQPDTKKALREAPDALSGYALRGRHTLAYGEKAWTIDSRTEPVSGIELAGWLVATGGRR